MMRPSLSLSIEVKIAEVYEAQILLFITHQLMFTVSPPTQNYLTAATEDIYFLLGSLNVK